MSKPVQSNRHAARRRIKADLQARGLCIWCRDPRGADGTKWNCRPCADRIASMSMSRQKWHREAGTCTGCGQRGQRAFALFCQPCADRTKARRIVRSLQAQSA
jgi:hypothetical protein